MGNRASCLIYHMPTVQEMLGQTASLTQTQRRIFEYMIGHPEAVCYETLKDISARIGAAEVSILNTCRKLGCTGYTDMKQEFRRYLGEHLKNTFNQNYTLETADEAFYQDRHTPVASMFETEQKIIASLAASVDTEQMERCAQLLMQAHEVLLYGHDVSKVLADYFAHRLNYLRIKASSFQLGDSSTVQTSLSMAGEQDVVVLFSFPPYYKPVSNAARYAEYRGATVIVITDSSDSPAITESTNNFICDTKTKFFFNTLIGPFSLINVLTSYIALKMGTELNEILEEELNASHFMSGEFEEEGADL